MEVIKIKGGYSFSLKNAAKNILKKSKKISYVAYSLDDLKNIKPKILVKEGDEVSRGSDLFFDKKNKRIRFTSPGGGVVNKICYGERRTLKSIIIKLFKEEKIRNFGSISYSLFKSLTVQDISTKLLESGLWQLLNVFPGEDYPPEEGVFDVNGQQLSTKIEASYISSFYTEPHGVNIGLVLRGREKYFIAGVKILNILTKKTFLFTLNHQKLDSRLMNIDGVTYKIIEDKYPAENMGTQMWYTNSLRRGTVGIGADIELVISIGYLFLTGKLQSERVFSVSGNGVKERHHILGRIGMMVSDLCDVDDNNSNRIITGGVFTGRKIVYNDFLGLRDNRLVIIKEDLRRIPFVFFRLGFDKLTLSRTWASCLNANYMHDLSTSKNGEERSCIQCGYCINVCPVKLMPNMIMKASLNNDIEQMENLSIYDCIDCGLCTFICPSKIELHHKIKDGKRLLYKEG